MHKFILPPIISHVALDRIALSRPNKPKQTTQPTLTHRPPSLTEVDLSTSPVYWEQTPILISMELDDALACAKALEEALTSFRRYFTMQ
jgi:hypothetical protein